jgi:ABC-type bacteriocin/lantibiotic exporter with double-glycine peptidase domain
MNHEGHEEFGFLVRWFLGFLRALCVLRGSILLCHSSPEETRLSTIERADRVIVLDQGKVARQGTFTEVQARQSALAEQVA